MSPRALQQAPFRVLVGANMPAVLVEMGFLTNPSRRSSCRATTSRTRGPGAGRRHRALPRRARRSRTAAGAAALMTPRGPRSCRARRRGAGGRVVGCSSAARPGTPSREPAPAAARPRPARRAGRPPERKITATLFYVTDDGTVAGRRAARSAVRASRSSNRRARIVEAQLGAAPAPLRLGDPAGHDAAQTCSSPSAATPSSISAARSTTKHPGGSLDELFTVYTIVNALTVNLPAITRVQILVDGKEVDTLAGHVDLRHPLAEEPQMGGNSRHPAQPRNLTEGPRP